MVAVFVNFVQHKRNKITIKKVNFAVEKPVHGV